MKIYLNAINYYQFYESDLYFKVIVVRRDNRIHHGEKRWQKLKVTTDAKTAHTAKFGHPIIIRLRVTYTMNRAFTQTVRFLINVLGR